MLSSRGLAWLLTHSPTQNVPSCSTHPSVEEPYHYVPDTQLALLTCSVFPPGGTQHVPSGRAARPGAHCPAALPQAVRTAPGSRLVLGGTDSSVRPSKAAPSGLPTQGSLRGREAYPHPTQHRTPSVPSSCLLPSRHPPNTTQETRSRGKGQLQLQSQGPEGTEGASGSQGDHEGRQECLTIRGVT